MPKQRLQVEAIPTIPLQPAARPVDSFLEPTAGQQDEQLAQGLARLVPGLENLSEVVSRRKAAANFAAGQKKARELAEQAANFRDAIRAGAITPNQSPFFMSGLKEQFGRLAADRMNFEFLTAAAQDETLQTSIDPADFDTFASNFRSQWMKNNLAEPNTRDAQFERGFGSMADAHLADNQRAFAAQLAGRVTRFAGDAHFSEVMNDVLAEWGRGTSVETLGTSITELNDAAHLRGMNGNLVNQLTVDAVIAAASRANDLGMLDILDHVNSGPAAQGGRRSLSTTRYGAAKLEEARHNISAEIQSQNTQDYLQHERRQAAAVDDIMQQVNNSLEQSGGSADLSSFRSMMNVVDPSKVSLIYQMRDAFNDHTIVDDPPAVASAFRRVTVANPGENYTSFEEAAGLLADRRISIASYRNLINDIQERDKVGIGRWAQDPVLKGGQSDIERMFGVEFGQTGENPNAVRLALEAKDEFTKRYIAWRKGAGANVDDPTDWVNRTRNEIFTRMTNRPAAIDYSRVPHANLGPQLPDPATQLVTDPSNVQALSKELDDWMAGRRNNLSPLSLDLLKLYGIPAKPDDIKKFVDQQRKFLNSPIARPDSTNQ